MTFRRALFRAGALIATLLCNSISPLLAQQAPAGAEIPGERLPAAPSVAESTADIMLRQSVTPPSFAPRVKVERELEVDRQANPYAPSVPYWPYNKGGNGPEYAPAPNAPQTVSLSFDGATLADTSAFPPDTMGTVGPTQWVTFVNGRIRTFTKAGVADGVINASPDVFFASVMTPIGGTITDNFTSDPQVRYDRFTARWFMSIIDVPCTSSGCGSGNNRWLLAVSDTSTITASTVWKFFYVTPDTTNFCDYPSLGIDTNALYFGCNMFSSAGFVGTNAYVVQKSSVLGSGPIVSTRFSVGTSSAGIYTPRGVDNLDATASAGYFVGTDLAAWSTIDFRRVNNPGSTSPTLSALIQVTVPTTNTNIPVAHAGNTGGNNGRLDSLDDRLFAATIRNGHLWTAHNLRVTATGVAGTTNGRMAARWYDFTNLTATPTLNQSGTVYDSAATLAAALQYWIPSIVASGQGHAVIGFSLAGTPSGATPAFTGRLSGDTLGSMSGIPGTGVVQTGTTAASYNPPSDPGGTSGRRWGDYSFTAVDPLDDMTIWTTQEYNQASNSYAARVTKLLAPPPATPTCSSTPINFSAGTGNVVINATSTAGSGFYDPGANLPAPALPFNHISATVSGGVTVNSVTYNSPTQVTLNITAATAGLRNVTITNPDGQSVTANGCINVTAANYTIGGSVSGLTASGLVLAVTAGSQTVSVPSGATSYVFPTAQPNGTAYTVSVQTQPTGLTCSVSNASGTISGANVVNANVACSVSQYTVTPSAGTGGSIAPSTPQTVNYNGTAQFTLTPSTGYHLVNVTGTCPAGSLSGNLWTTGAITANCTVVANFAIDTFTVTPSAGTGGSIAPSTPQTVNYNGTAQFTLTPGTGYHLVNVTGTCPAGSLSGNLWTTGAITADCTVVANFAANPADHLVFSQTPANVLQGNRLGAVVVSIVDVDGNVISTDSSSQVTLSVTACGGPITLAQVTVSNGVASFPADATQRFYTLATGRTLSAGSGSLSGTANFDVVVNNDMVFPDGFESCRL